jgi:hypothetical protein
VTWHRYILTSLPSIFHVIIKVMTYRSERKQEAARMGWDRKLQLQIFHLCIFHCSYEDAMHKDEADLPDLAC